MRKARILMVDDNNELLTVNREFFEGKGYAVLEAINLEQARLCIENDNPDLILLDVMLPDGSGLDFCHEIREKTSAPIIFLSCRDENESVIKGLLRGGDDYVPKPCDLNVLNARVTAQFRRVGFVSAGKIELSPLSIDFLTGETMLDGKRISLTQKEIQLLGCFVLSVGRRLTCDELYKRAWGESNRAASRTIAVHVTNLRRKLALDENSWFELVNTGKEEYIFRKVKY